ncbi:DUF6542 domain-containing protein [Mycobacterium sp.]|uniref:DUF6542 domain-containing protein n=1 Tax=Mycobacterium sp. TaxID=1785 RepID=UPI0025E69705|nr:DUF6542 domain-containing protein [Mycobacterium sp.]MBW0015301.1 hypothetical protein [Mycobacterium sp.]
MSAQREASAVEAGHRSIHPNIPGVPWWAALVIALTATAIGYGIDAGSGHKELTHVFAIFYIAGCVAAVLAVRQEGVFTAIIQPPLILFCAVPGAYWLFHGRKIGNLKDLLINCGYPLIERFPMMLGTAGGVLLIGLIRWFFGKSQRTGTETAHGDQTGESARSHSFIGAVAAKLGSLLAPGTHDEDLGGDPGEAAPPRRTRARTSREATARSDRSARGGRSATRPTRTHSRHARPATEDDHEPVAERPRRRRQARPRDADPADIPGRTRRRPRPQGDPEPLGQPPRETRRETRRNGANPYEWPYDQEMPRSSRFDGPNRYGDRYEDRYEPPGASGRFNRYAPYEADPAYEPPRRRRAAAGGPNGATPTHHPISRVRYRGQAPVNESRPEPGGEPRAERRSRSRPPAPPAESWEYDV